MLGSRWRLPHSDPGSVPVVFDSHRAYISVEHLSRIYSPPRWGRLHQMFSVFGGIHETGDSFFDDDDDDTDGDEGFDDDVEETVDRAGRLRVALSDVSLTAVGGSSIGIVGGPGAGKSVLIRVLAGIAAPSEGRVVVHGLAAPVLPMVMKLFPQYGKLARLVPHVWRLLDLRVRKPRRRAAEVFRLVEEPELARLPVRSVNGRERWKFLLFAMMLVIEPDILLIDSGLPDGKAGEKCRELILELKRGGGLVVITGVDAESVAWVADRVITLEGGKIVADEPVDEAARREAIERIAAEKAEAERVAAAKAAKIAAADAAAEAAAAEAVMP